MSPLYGINMGVNDIDIRELRRLLGLNQKKFAHKVGVSARTVRRWENGQFDPSPLALEKLQALVKKGLKEKGRESKNGTGCRNPQRN